MKRLIPALFLLLPLLAHAEISLGGTATTGFDVMLASVTGEDPSYTGTLDLAFQINVDSEYFTLALEPGFHYNWNTNALNFFLDRAELLISPADFLSLVIGHFLYTPGTSEMVSATNYFTGTDYKALLSGNLEKIRIPNNLIQAKVFAGDFYLTLTAAPFHLQPILPEPDSPWFSTKELPQTLTYPPPINQVLELGNIIFEQQETESAALDKISLAAEAGVQLPFMDCSLIFYNGDDNSLLLGAEIDFPHGLFGDYDIYLTPLQPTMMALGLNLATNIAALRLWADASWSFSRTFMTNKLSETSFKTIPAQSPYLEYVFGTSLEVEALNLILLAEYRNSHILQPAEGIIQPLLTSLLSCSAALRLFDYTTQLRGLMLLSLADYSLVSGVSLSFSPAEEFTLEAVWPIYTGTADTLFGQYAANSHFTLALTVRY